MGRFSAARVFGAKDSQFMDRYNYLLGLLDTEYSVTSILSGQRIDVKINTKDGLSFYRQLEYAGGIDLIDGHLTLSSADGMTYFDLEEPEIVVTGDVNSGLNGEIRRAIINQAHLQFKRTSYTPAEPYVFNLAGAIYMSDIAFTGMSPYEFDMTSSDALIISAYTSGDIESDVFIRRDGYPVYQTRKFADFDYANEFYGGVNVYSGNLTVAENLVLHEGNVNPMFHSGGYPYDGNTASNPDLNTLTSPGHWSINGTPTNAPSTSYYGTVLNYYRASGSNYLIQIYTDSTGTRFNRYYTVSTTTWSAWETNIDTSSTAQEKTGKLTLSGGGGETLELKAGATADHVYLEFFADSASQTTRSGYFGFGSAGTSVLSLINEMTNGGITISPNGTGELKLGVSTNKLGFFGVTPVVKGTAFTQTYSSYSHTHSAMTAAALTNDTLETPTHTIARQGSTYSQQAINAGLSSLCDAIEEVRADQLNTAKCLNALINDLQALGLV